MNASDKTKLLEALSEDEVRRLVMVPLLSKMGFLDPIIHHHSAEKGKDIVCKEVDSKFGRTRYIAVIVKKGDVTGSASGSASYFALLNQIRQSLNEPYKHIYDLRQVDIDQCILVITGRFIATSLESVYGTLKAERLDKAIRETIDIGRLPGLIDSHYPEFWQEPENRLATLEEQRNTLLNNFGKLLTILKLKEHQREGILRNVLNSEIELEADSYGSIRRYVANIGYRKIEINEIDEYFTDETISNYFADIHSYFFDIKQKAKEILYDLDEPIGVLKSMLEEKSPERMVELSEQLQSYVGHGHNICVDSKDIEQQEDFGIALDEYRKKKDALIRLDLIDFYHEVYEVIYRAAIEALERFYEQNEKKQRNKWLGMKVKYSLSSKVVSKPELYTFEEEPAVVEKSSHVTDLALEKVYLVGTDELHIEICINRYGFFREDDLSPAAKAKESCWHYTQAFEKHLFSQLADGDAQ